MKKRRHVRRRQLTSADRQLIFKEAAKSAGGGVSGDGELECAICCSTFAETPYLATIQLPGCGHLFHTPCIQHTADTEGQCPLCRADVDWKALLGIAVPAEDPT